MFVFPVGPLFRLRVSHHLDHAPFPHPAHQTGRAVFPHPAFGQGLLNSDSHTFAHEPLLRRLFKLVQSQLLVQVLVREAFLSLSPLLELRTQPFGVSHVAWISLYRHAVVNTPVARWVLIARGTAYSTCFPFIPSDGGLPHTDARSATTLDFSRPA